MRFFSSGVIICIRSLLNINLNNIMMGYGGFGGYGMMSDFGFWGWFLGLGAIVWVVAGVLLIIFLWKQITKR